MATQPASEQIQHGLTIFAFVLHIGAGVVGLTSGLVAAFARKGGSLHRRAGTAFTAAMLMTAVFAIWLALVRPGQFVNAFIGTFTLYLVATAWLTVHRRDGAIGSSEKIALAVALLLCAPFAILTFQLAAGLSPFLRSAVPFEGPVLIAIYVFTAVLVLAVVGDTRLVLGGGISGAPRTARHLWRMCLALTLAVGSFTTNALPRLLPGPIHVGPALFVPQLLVLGFLVFWLIRVRFTRWTPT